MDNFNKKIFSIDTSVARPNGFQLFRGETMDVVCNIGNYTNPVNLDGATASAYWRSKDMASGNSWYTGPVDVSGSSAIWHWTDENDSGANMYDWFIRISDSDDSSYRAFGVLEMLGSPAGNPSAVPIPTTVLNFDDYTLMGTIPPENLAERYLRNSSQLGNEVNYVINSTVFGSSYFDELYDLEFTDTEGNTHTVTIDAINEYDWRNAANVLEAQGRTNYSFGGYNTFFVSFYVDGSDDNTTVEGVNAFFQKSGNLYTLTAHKGSDFLLILYLQRSGTDGFSIYRVDLKSANPSDLGFAINGTQSLGALNGALFTDEKLWSGNLISESELALQLDSVKVKDGSITTAKLANGAVTTGKLADFSVTTNKIAVGSVTPEKLNRAYVTDFGTSTSDTLGDDGQHLTPMLRNGYWGLSGPDAGYFDVTITAENGHSFDFHFSSFPMPDVVKMINAGTDGTFSDLEPLNLECEVTVTDTETDDSVTAYPLLSWTFDIDNNGYLTAEGVGYFEEDIPMHMWVELEKEGNAVKCYHVYIAAGDAQHTILGTGVDNDADGNLGTFVTETPASLGRLVTELDLQANQVEVAQSDWNELDTTAPDYIKNKPVVLPLETDTHLHYYKSTTTEQLYMTNGDESKGAWIQVPRSTSSNTATVGTNGRLIALQLQKYSAGVPENPLTIPAGATANDAVARTSDLPAFETWTFTLSGGTTVTKNVAIY